jgi:hypothetical protein
LTGFQIGNNLFEENRGVKMSDQNDFIKDSSSILEDIESQLNQTLEKKRKEIEEELEEKISREKEEARQKITKIEEELNQDKQTLQDYRVVISEFDDTKKEIKQEIKTHLEKASEYQKQIDALTENTLEELRTVSELHAKLEEAGKDAAKKIGDLKTDLQEKYGITAELPDSSPGFMEDFDLDGELDKLRKIKELLDLNGSNITAVEIQDSETDETKTEPERMGWSTELKEMESPPEKEEEPQPDAEEKPAEEAEEAEPESREEMEEPAESEAEKTGTSFLSRLKRFTSGKSEDQEKISETLEKFRKAEGGNDEEKIIYYENEGTAILDGEQILSVINRCMQESETLYESLMNTESPKDQFFIKQEIIKQQESVRKFMLNCIRICEQKDCVFPETTREFFNADILKDILERVSMENWSNHEDFERFSVFMEELAENYQGSIHSPEEFADALVQGLRKGT